MGADVTKYQEVFWTVTRYFGGDTLKGTKWMLTSNPSFGGLSPAEMFNLNRADKVAAVVQSQLRLNRA